jgi:urocanate hydratase
MSGAQPKAGNIAGCVSVTAEVNPKAAYKRYEQGWVDEVVENIDELSEKVRAAKAAGKAKSFAFIGNIVEVWEGFDRNNISVELGSDQTSLQSVGGWILSCGV